MNDTRFHWAAEYWDRGCSLIPLVGKKPPEGFGWKRYQTVRATLDDIRCWFEPSSEFNIGVLTGSISGIIVVDCDTPEDARWWAKTFPSTRLVSVTGRGGAHMFYRDNPEAPIGNRARVLGRLRFFTVYGPRQRPQMAIYKFVRKCLAGEAIPFFGDGSTRRDYTYIDDIVDGVVRALDRVDSYEIYNLGESQTVSLSELVSVIGEVTGVEPILDRQPLQPGDVLITYADVSKARRDLGYLPRTALRDGLELFLEWYRETQIGHVEAR